MGAETTKPSLPIGPYDYQPSFAHYSLTALYKAGLLHKWFQQNHDGLPQKAGLPQHAINEIHGAWYDPSNPVVKMSGQLRGDLFQELLDWEETSHLCITVGTSLSGMNADRLVESCGERALARAKVGGLNAALGGSVIVGFQCTRLDHVASLRIYSTIDKVFTALMAEMGIEPARKMFSLTKALMMTESLTNGHIAGDDIFDIFGYNARTGECITNNVETRSKTQRSFILDLREGARVVIASGPHKGAIGEVITKTRQGDYRIRFQVSIASSSSSKSDNKSSMTEEGLKKMTSAPWNTVLGAWWVLGALTGEVPYLPVVPER